MTNDHGTTATQVPTLHEHNSAQLEAHLCSPATLVIDIRDREACRVDGRIAGAVEVPLDELDRWIDALEGVGGEVTRARHTIVVCAGGGEAPTAAARLQQQGFEHVGVLVGGFRAWKADGRAVTGLSPWHQTI